MRGPSLAGLLPANILDQPHRRGHTVLGTQLRPHLDGAPVQVGVSRRPHDVRRQRVRRHRTVGQRRDGNRMPGGTGVPTRTPRT